MTATLTTIQRAVERTRTKAKNRFVPFHRAELSDVPDYSDAELLRLIEWAEHNRTRLRNQETIGPWSAVCEWNRTINGLGNLKRAAETEARGRNLLPERNGGKV